MFYLTTNVLINILLNHSLITNNKIGTSQSISLPAYGKISGQEKKIFKLLIASVLAIHLITFIFWNLRILKLF